MVAETQRRELGGRAVDLYGGYFLDRRANYYEIKLNDKDITVDFMGYNLPMTGQYGLLGYVNLQGGVVQEKNVLRIKKKLEDNESEWTIPFRYIEN